MLKRMLLREIRASLGRFLALFAIIALGVGFFTGLRVTKAAMLDTEQRYLDEQAMFDFHLVSTVGFDTDAAQLLRADARVQDAEGCVTQDALVEPEDEERTYVVKFLSLPERVNRPVLTAGRLPEAPDECVADAMVFTEADLGKTLHLSPDNPEDVADAFCGTEYTIVGLASSPIFMNYERGGTSLGTGTVLGFALLPRESFSADYDSDLYLTIPTAGEVYSDTYQDEIDAATDGITTLGESLANTRYDRLFSDAQQEVADAQAEYEDGLSEYETQKADAEAEIADAEDSLADARAELDDGWAQLTEAERELETQSADAETQLAQSAQELQDALAALYDGEAAYEDGVRLLSQQRNEWESGCAQYDAALADYQAQADAVGQQREALEAAMPRETLNAQLNALAAQLGLPDATAAAQALNDPAVAAAVGAESAAALKQAVEGYAALDSADAQLNSAKAQLDATKQQLDAGGVQLDAGQAQLNASRRELDAGWTEYYDGQAAFESARTEFERSTAEARQEIADHRQELEDGETEYADGLAELEDARAEADREFADAEAELADGAAALSDARDELADFLPPDVYVLGRDTNIGYVCFDSDANIVASVARVFPLFFFLVAALVCITTMTRMVEDQRTEIGTLKALGYSGRAIMAKFMAYSGAATLLGSLFGYLFGSWLFPFVLWRVYGIMYTIPLEIQYTLDVPLALVIIPAFLLCMCAATWFSCYRALGEVAAELIRPRTPNAGKKIWMEYLTPIWRRMKFLHKVCARNIFSYHRRLFMMIVGIGGCTALVLTGLGLNDSIQGVCEDQYGEITLYDYDVTFSEAQSQQAQDAFRAHCGDAISDCIFLSALSADVSAGNQTKTVHMIVTDAPMTGYLDFHDGDQPLEMPEAGEALINNGLAASLRLSVGDSVTVYDGNMRPMTLTVCGIYDNYIYNYLYTTPESCKAGWGYVPEIKSAQVLRGEGWDVHASAAIAMDADDVTNVSVNADMQSRVDSMLDSLIYIVLLVLACAGALAFIVLYNLTNINIAERLREIATLKVLGFRPLETAAYVFRENIVLTAFGIIVGLPLGILLHAYVMDQIRIDMISFATKIAFPSYCIAVGLTFVFALVVNFFMYFRLEKINMAESLKSVE